MKVRFPPPLFSCLPNILYRRCAWHCFWRKKERTKWRMTCRMTRKSPVCSQAVVIDIWSVKRFIRLLTHTDNGYLLKRFNYAIYWHGISYLTLPMLPYHTYNETEHRLTCECLKIKFSFWVEIEKHSFDNLLSLAF